MHLVSINIITELDIFKMYLFIIFSCTKVIKLVLSNSSQDLLNTTEKGYFQNTLYSVIFDGYVLKILVS